MIFLQRQGARCNIPDPRKPKDAASDSLRDEKAVSRRSTVPRRWDVAPARPRSAAMRLVQALCGVCATLHRQVERATWSASGPEALTGSAKDPVRRKFLGPPLAVYERCIFRVDTAHLGGLWAKWDDGFVCQETYNPAMPGSAALRAPGAIAPTASEMPSALAFPTPSFFASTCVPEFRQRMKPSWRSCPFSPG